MHRRAALGPTDLFALGRRVHGRLLTSRPSRACSPHESETVATVADLIIPTTDTPGARAADVVAMVVP